MHKHLTLSAGAAGSVLATIKYDTSVTGFYYPMTMIFRVDSHDSIKRL